MIAHISSAEAAPLASLFDEEATDAPVAVEEPAPEPTADAEEPLDQVDDLDLDEGEPEVAITESTVSEEPEDHGETAAEPAAIDVETEESDALEQQVTTAPPTAEAPLDEVTLQGRG